MGWSDSQRFKKEAFLSWAAKLKQRSGAQIHVVYEACGDYQFADSKKKPALGLWEGVAAASHFG